MRKRIYLGVLFMVIVLLTGCTGGGGNGSNTTHQLTVSIYDSVTNTLLEEDVYLALDGEGQTTSSGTYVFTNLSPGTKTLEASSQGYAIYEADITLNEAKEEHEIYLAPDDQGLQTLVTNIRNAGISLTNVWEPQAARLERHIVDKVTPFTEELGDLLYALMEPLNDPYFDFDVSYSNDRIYFSQTYTHYDNYYYPTYTVEYAIDMADYLHWEDTGQQSMLNVSFDIYEGSIHRARGLGQLNAMVTHPGIYNEWVAWIDDPYYYPEPDRLFFSAADMTADAWFLTPSFGSIDTSSELYFDVDSMTITADGTFDSEVMYQEGHLSMTFAEIDELYYWEFPVYPEELEFSGHLEFPGIAEIQGELNITFVLNHYHETIMPDAAQLMGSYRDLNSAQEEILAEGSFEYNWSKAATFREDYTNLGLTAEFSGFVQEPQRPRIELTLDARFDSLLRGNVTIEYAFEQHFLRGSASYSNLINSNGEIISSSVDIQLKNEHDLAITLVLNENLKEQQPTIGEIKGPQGKLLAELGLSGGLPVIFYPNGHFESLL